MSARRRSAWLLWLSAPAFLWLSLHRPFTVSEGRAARMPARVGGFTLHEETPLTPRERELLGTDDATWRTYRDARGGEVYVIAVFHQHNWKSVHPPHLCLRGSDMVIETDDLAAPLAITGVECAPGRVLTHSRSMQRPYLSLFLYGADGLRTGSYAEFVQHHIPRALLRRAAPGYLLRVEAWNDDPAAQERCRDFVRDAVPILETLLR